MYKSFRFVSFHLFKFVAEASCLIELCHCVWDDNLKYVSDKTNLISSASSSYLLPHLNSWNWIHPKIKSMRQQFELLNTRYELFILIGLLFGCCVTDNRKTFSVRRLGISSLTSSRSPVLWYTKSLTNTSFWMEVWWDKSLMTWWMCSIQCFIHFHKYFMLFLFILFLFISCM